MDWASKFGSRFAAILATVLLALSHFDVIFAQTARYYSWLTVMGINSSLLLLRALCLRTWQNWVLYALGIAIGFYTNLIFRLAVISNPVDCP
jgi:uncharacterized membrane protein